MTHHDDPHHDDPQAPRPQYSSAGEEPIRRTAEIALRRLPSTNPAELWVLVACIMGSSIVSIDSSALNVALPALQSDLGASGSGLLWIINAYTMLLSALILVGGSLGDLYGRKRVFRTGVAVFVAASVLCGLAPSTEALIAFRALQGIGGALLVPGSLALISAVFPPERRGAAIGSWATFSTLMIVVGPVLGGILAGAGLWRLIFFINVPLSLVVFYALPKVPESRDESHKGTLDYIGAALVTVGLAGVSFGFIQGDTLGWDTPTIIGALGVGLLSFAAFVYWETVTDAPMVPLALFKNRTFAGTNLLTLFLYAALGGLLFFLPINLIQVQGYRDEYAGLAALPTILLLTLMARWSGGLIDRVGARLPLVVGPTIAGVGFFGYGLIGLTDGPADYWTSFFPAALVVGFGLGIFVAPLTTAVMNAAPSDQTGTASGINNAISRTAGVLAVAILGAVALVSFRAGYVDELRALDLPAEITTALEDDAGNLAGIELDDRDDDITLTAAEQDAVQTVIDDAFVDTFQILAFAAAGLAWISALIAFLMVEPRPQARVTG